MTESQRRSAVARKRSKAQGVGGKPTNVATFTQKEKKLWVVDLWLEEYGNDVMRKHNIIQKELTLQEIKRILDPLTKSGAGMTRAGVKAYRRLNPWF